MTVIYGKRGRYKVENLPERVRRAADKIPTKGNPTTEYCCEDVEGFLEELGKELGINIKHADIRHDF